MFFWLMRYFNKKFDQCKNNFEITTTNSWIFGMGNRYMSVSLFQNVIGQCQIKATKQKC